MTQRNTPTEGRPYPITAGAVTAGTVPPMGRFGDGAAGALTPRVADQLVGGTDRTPVRRSETHESHSESVPGGITENDEGEPDR